MVDPGYDVAKPDPVEALTLLVRGVAIVAGALFAGLSLYRAFQVGSLHFHATGPLALENPVIAGIMLTARGINVYDPSTYQDIPFYIQMYPPAYYYLMAWLPEWPGSPYVAGRVVSGFFMVCAGLLVFAGGRARTLLPGALLLFAFFVSVYPVATNTMLARQDPMALFFAGASVVILLRSGGARWMVVFSALLAVVALTSKQSYVAAPVAALVYLGVTDRALLRVYLAVFAALSLMFVIGAHLMWGSGFWWSTVQTLPADFRPEFYSWLTGRMADQWTYVAFVGLVVAVLAYGLTRPGERAGLRRARDLPLLYLILATLVCLATLPKDGASLNYFFEPTLAGVLFVQHRFSGLPPRLLFDRWLPTVALVFAVALAADVRKHPTPPAFTSPSGQERAQESLSATLADLATLPGVAAGALPNAVFVYPTIRNRLPNLGVMPILPDDYLYSILIADGRLDSGLFADAVVNRRFDVVILPLEIPEPAVPGLGERFHRALDDHYREVRRTEHRYLMRRDDGTAGRLAPAGRSSGHGP